MGLNLGPLKRVVFSAVRKWDGVGERALTNSEIRQIAGRAGRFGHQDEGYVAAVDETGLEPIRAALAGAPTAPAADTRFLRAAGPHCHQLGGRGDAHRQPARGAGAFRPRHLLCRFAVPAFGPGGNPRDRPRGGQGAAADCGEVRVLGLPGGPARPGLARHAGALDAGTGGRTHRPGPAGEPRRRTRLSGTYGEARQPPISGCRGASPKPSTMPRPSGRCGHARTGRSNATSGRPRPARSSAGRAGRVRGPDRHPDPRWTRRPGGGLPLSDADPGFAVRPTSGARPGACSSRTWCTCPCRRPS